MGNDVGKQPQKMVGCTILDSVQNIITLYHMMEAASHTNVDMRTIHS